MKAAEYEDFVKCMRQFAGVLRGKPLTDDDLQVYWGALRDRPFEDVRRRLETHSKTSKFFPKPHELRPFQERPEVEQSAKAKAEYEAALRFSTESWRMMFDTDPELAELEFSIARAARISVETADHDVAHQQAAKEMRQLMDARLALWAARAKAKRAA